MNKSKKTPTPIPKKSSRPKIKLISPPKEESKNKDFQRQKVPLKGNLKSLKLKGKKLVKTTSLQSERNKIYKQKKEIYLKENLICELCQRRAAVSLHHRAFRKGFNLTRFFMGLCMKCHTWIHEHPRESRELNLLLEIDSREESVDETLEIYQIKPNNIGNIL